jgi:hypothetical protein
MFNTALLSCVDGRNEFIEGSPANAFMNLTCVVAVKRNISAGDFCTFTQGGWGANCNGQNPGCFRDAYFSAVFPYGVGIGQGVACTTGSCGQNPLLDGAPLYAALWKTSASIEAYLPAGSTPGKLTADLTNPASTSSGVLGGQLISATLAVAFDDAGKFDIALPFKKMATATKLGELKFSGGTPCDGQSVRAVIALADVFVSGGASSLDATQLGQCLDILNNGFDGCALADTTHFVLP